METYKIIDRYPAGVVTPPPSKSYSHRALICASMAAYMSGRPQPVARAEKHIKNLGASDDISATKSCLSAMFSRGKLSDAPHSLDCRESGSTMRFLLPLAAVLSESETIFSGGGRLPDRPQTVYEDILPDKTVLFEKRADGIHIKGPLRPGIYTVRGDVSSQFVSGLLFALPILDGDSEIRLSGRLESFDYVLMTMDILSAYGVETEIVYEDDSDEIRGFNIPGGQTYRESVYRVESDWSQAAFFLCAAALGRDIYVDGLDPGSMQGDRRILNILSLMGIDPRVSTRAFPRSKGSLVDATRTAGGELRAIELDMSNVPDLVPPVAALCCFAKGVSRLRDLKRLRMKESDRLSALCSALSALGADIREEGDDLVIIGADSLSGGVADAAGDHRIAMAVAVASVRCEGEVKLSGYDSVNKSYPDFWKDFEREV